MFCLRRTQPVAGYTGHAGKLLRQRHQPCKPHSVKTWHKLRATMQAAAAIKAGVKEPRTFKTSPPDAAGSQSAPSRTRRLGGAEQDTQTEV